MNQKEIERLDELEDKALESYLENSDYKPADFLDDKEKEEYLVLFEKFLTDLNNE